MSLKQKPRLPEISICSYRPNLFCLDSRTAKECERKNKEIERRNQEEIARFNREMAEWKASQKGESKKLNTEE